MPLGPKALAKLQNVFNQYDTTGKGTLTFDEFGKLMGSLGRKMTVAEVNDLVTRHAETHPDHTPEDVEHIPFELFCYIVQASKKKKLARKKTMQLVKEGLSTFLERRRLLKLPELDQGIWKGVDPNLLESMYASYANALPTNHADMKPDMLSILVDDQFLPIILKHDPTITKNRIKSVMKNNVAIKYRSKKWKTSKGKSISFQDIVAILALGPEDTVLWAAKKMENNRATLKMFNAIDTNNSGKIEVLTELAVGLDKLTGANTTEEHAINLAARVHADQKRRGVEVEHDPNELDFSQFCLLIALINSEETGWNAYVAERIKNNDTSQEDLIPMLPNRRQLFAFFTEMDGSRCGEISPQDLLHGMHKIGRTELTLRHVQEMFEHKFHGEKKVDTDNDGAFNFPEFINLMAMLLMGPAKDSEWEKEVIKRETKEVIQTQNETQEQAADFYNNITDTETNTDRNCWWYQCPYGFKWPSKKLNSVEVSGMDKTYVNKYINTHSNAIDVDVCLNRLKKMYKKNPSRKDVEEMIVNIFSPYEGLHLFTFSEMSPEGEDVYDMDVPLTRKDAAVIDQYLRSEWKQPKNMRDSTNTTSKTPTTTAATATLGKQVSPKDGSVTIAGSHIDAARLALLPAADGTAGNRSNPITRNDALDVVRAAISGMEEKDICTLTGTLLNVPGFRWPAGRGAMDTTLDERDWSYILNEYFIEAKESGEIVAQKRKGNRKLSRTKTMQWRQELSFEMDLKQPLAMGITHPETDESKHFQAVVTEVHNGGQAEIAGIEIGMHIYSIDGISCKDQTLEWVIQLITEHKNKAQTQDDGANATDKMIMVCVKETAPAKEAPPTVSSGAYINTTSGDAVRWSIEGMCAAAGMSKNVSKGGQGLQTNNSSTNSNSNNSYNNVMRKHIESLLLLLVEDITQNEVFRQVPKPLQPAGIPIGLSFQWPNSRKYTNFNLIDLDNDDRQALHSILNPTSNAISFYWKDRFTQQEKRSNSKENVLYQDGLLVEVALKTCMSSQCITRADACKVIRALVLGQTEEDIRMAVSPLTFGKFEYRWTRPGPKEDVVTDQMRIEAIDFLHLHANEASNGMGSKEHLDAAILVINTKKDTTESTAATATPDTSNALSFVDDEIEGCATRGDIETVLRAWSEGKDPEFIKSSHGTSGFNWLTPSLGSDGTDLLTQDDKNYATKYVTSEFTDQKHVEKLETVKNLFKKCITRGHIECVIRSLSRSESVAEILKSPCLVERLPRFAWSRPGLRTDEMDDGDREAVQTYAASISDITLRACSGCDYRGTVEDLLRAANKTQDEETLMTCAPGSGGVPNLFWPSFGLPRDEMNDIDLRFAKGFAAALAEVASFGMSMGVFEDEADNISVSAAQDAIKGCGSRRQAECVLCALCDDGNQEAVVAAIYMGKWKRSHCSPPTQTELDAASKAENRYRNRSLWRKAKNGTTTTADLTDTELNLAAAVAIDVAAHVLGLTYEQSGNARKTVLHAIDDKHRASILQACLEPLLLTNLRLRKIRTDFDINILKDLLQNSPLPNDVIASAMSKITPTMTKNEDARGQHLIDTFLECARVPAVIEGEESSQTDVNDVSIYGTRVDREHRSKYEAIINAVITFDTKRKKSILSAVHEAEKWSQLTEIFIAAIRGDGNKMIMKKSRKLYNDVLEINYLNQIKENVRMSYMHEGASGDMNNKMQEDLTNSNSHYELAHALLQLIENYSNKVLAMNNSRQGKSRFGYNGSPPLSSKKKELANTTTTGTKGTEGRSMMPSYSTANNPAVFENLRKESFVTLMKNSSLLRDDVREVTVLAMSNVNNVHQALGVVLASMSRDALTSAKDISNDVTQASKVWKSDSNFITRQEREGGLKIIYDAKHVDGKGTCTRAKAEIINAREKNHLFEMIEVVLLSYERNQPSNKKKKTEKYVANGKLNEKASASTKTDHLEHHAVANGGDLLAHINGLGEKTNPLIVNDLPPVLSQREAMEQIKGIDLMRKEKKKSKHHHHHHHHPSKPSSGEGKDSPKSKQITMVVTKNGVTAVET